MRKMLYDYFRLFDDIDYPGFDKKIEIDGKEYDREDVLLVRGVPHVIEMTMNPTVQDSECMRVKIDGEYYYFG